MDKKRYLIGWSLQIFSTIVYLLLVAALVDDLSYMYDRQMFAGSEQVLFVGFIKQLLPLTVVYVIIMFIGKAFKSAYKSL